MASADGGVVEFDVCVPVGDDIVVEHVKHALGLGLPELRDFEYPWNDELHIVANGPSARQAPLHGKTLAINGALKLFTDQGLAPTYWIACDPQELVVNFLKDAPAETTYLVASKCHPRVFEALVGRNVILFHMDDTAARPILQERFAVSRFVSVTICCFEVLARMGWRKFHTWGWDCCKLEGVENAVAQDNAPTNITVEIDGAKFESTTSWALEAQDALSMVKGFPFHIVLHGPGMMGPMLKAFLPARVTVAS